MSTEQAREAAAWACHRGLGWPTFSKKYIPPVRPAATITWPIMLAVPAPALPSRLSGCIVLDWTAHELDGAASAAAASGSCGLVPGPLTRSDPGANIATVVISACPWKTSYAEFLFWTRLSAQWNTASAAEWRMWLGVLHQLMETGTGSTCLSQGAV